MAVRVAAKRFFLASDWQHLHGGARPEVFRRAGSKVQAAARAEFWPAVRQQQEQSSKGEVALGGQEARLIVLSHGFMGGRRIQLTPFTYFRGIAAHLESSGFDVLITEVPATAKVSVRAEALCEQIAGWEKRGEGQRVTVLAHSMGGLDSRYAISRLGGDALVSSLLTVATPHHGSHVADFAMKCADGLHVCNMVQKLPVRLLSDAPGGGRCLTTAAMKEFNREVPNKDQVSYLSVGGHRGTGLRTSPELLATYLYLYSKEGPNDGLVSLRASRWGCYVGTLDMDHLHQINFPLPHRWVTGAPSYKDVLATWRWLAEVATSGAKVSKDSSTSPPRHD